MESDGSWVTRAAALIGKCREVNVPIVFIQEAHRRDLVDFGRELDGQEDVHLLEGDFGTEIRSEGRDERGRLFHSKAPILLLFWY